MFLALIAFALIATMGCSPAHADDLENARRRAIQSGKPLMIVFR